MFHSNRLQIYLQDRIITKTQNKEQRLWKQQSKAGILTLFGSAR